MVYLIFDTNIWIYLANGHDPYSKSERNNNHFEFLQTLKNLRKDNKIRILVNDIITNEWKRNKSNVHNRITKLKRKLACADNSVKDILKYTTRFNGLTEEYKEGLKEEIQANQDHIKNVEDLLFSDCINTGLSDSLKLKVFQLAVDKLVPLHKGKNNIGDISILLSSYEYLKENMEYDLPAYFVSNNWQDFTDEIDKDSFHPEINNMLSNVNIQYERILPKAIKLTKETISEFEEYLQQQHYLDSIYFSCLEPLCHVSESFEPFGYLDRELKVFYRSILERDPNQLELYEFEIPDYLTDRTTKSGQCFLCGTIHLICTECGELNYWNWDNEEIICTECNCEMQLSNDYDLNVIVNKIAR